MNKMVKKDASKAKSKSYRKIKAATKKGTKLSSKEDTLTNGYEETENDGQSSEITFKRQKSDEVAAESMQQSSSKKEAGGMRERNIAARTSHRTTSEVSASQEAAQSSKESDMEIERITQPSKSQKRKSTVVAEKSGKQVERTTSVKTKAKRQKVFLEIPPVRSIPGKVFVIGENDVGQLGFNEDVEVMEKPALLELLQSIVDIAAGGMHSVCLTESGEVITFGCNDEGALGRITTEEGSEYTPGRVDIRERVIQISAGDSHSAALTDSGQVYIWGNFRSGDGPIGLTADGTKQLRPIRILNNVTVVRISSGSDHLVCLSNDGIVYTCGCGEVGQLGRVTQRTCHSGGRKGRATLLEPEKVHVIYSSKAIFIDEIWTGYYATFLRAKASGSIYAFGLNNYNQLGQKSNENETVIFNPQRIKSFDETTWQQINGGQHHTLALDNKGIVYSLGRKEYGRLGLGENSDEPSVPTVIPTLQNETCREISAGNCVSFAVTEQGSVYSWGMGTNHQLGHGDEEDCHEPCPIEDDFSALWKVLKVSGGGQHTLLLACPRQNLEKE